MFVPLTHDRMVVSRWPVASVGVIALCVAVFLGTHWSEAERASDELFAAAASYALRNPRLDADPRLLSGEMRERFWDEAGELGIEPAHDGDQEELDALTSSWLESTAQAPHWRWGLVPKRFEPATVVTHMFLHGGWLHLIGNVFLLYLTGPLIEDRVGHLRFAALYLVCGLLAGALYGLQNADLFRPLIGASGAIAGVMGAFAVLFARVRMRFLVWLGIPLGTMEAPAWVLLPFWFGLQLVEGLRADVMQPAGAGGVAFWAHVWGFGAGVAFGFAYRRERPHELDLASAGPDRLEQALALLPKKRWDEAWDLLVAEARSGARREEASRALWDLAKESGRALAAAPYFVRLIRAETRGGDALRAAELWRELRGALRSRPADPSLAVEVAEALERAREGREAREELIEAALEGLGSETPPELGERLAQLAQRHRTAGVRRALSAAGQRADLEPAIGKAAAVVLAGWAATEL